MWGRINAPISNTRSPIRSPIHVICIISLTNSLTNLPSYHMRPQISHLTVLKFAHQFATWQLLVRLTNCPLNLYPILAAKLLKQTWPTSCPTFLKDGLYVKWVAHHQGFASILYKYAQIMGNLIHTYPERFLKSCA